MHYKPFTTFGKLCFPTQIIDLRYVFKVRIPAAKCRGVDFRPAVSLAFTVWAVINFFTRIASPVLHASNNSRSGSVGGGNTSSADPRIERRLDMVISRFTFSFRVLNTHYGDIVK